MRIHQFLKLAVEKDASDLHLTAGFLPALRIRGELFFLEDFPSLKNEDTRELAFSMITPEQKEKFEKEFELDFSYSLEGLGRFRVNLYLQKDGVGIAIRAIPSKIPTPGEIGLPSEVINLTNLRNGLILVTGVTGSGKSTTLASLINKINEEKPCHILTVEDPIEFVYPHKKAIINQREVGANTKSFASALKYALREDPDIALVGEMRDLETISAALTIAETGHLVFTTLHTLDAAQSVDRIINVFPSHQQQEIRTVLGGVLRAVICQQLLPSKDGKGRIAAREILFNTYAIANLIREGKIPQMYSAIQTGRSLGMMTMDSDVVRLFREGVISRDIAEKAVTNPKELDSPY
ncbi:MAG: type IV pilus twitching motility protein PilT [Candidatus Omnitrophota bacterium]